MVLKLLNSTKQAHWASFVLLSLMLKILVIQLALIFVALYTVHPQPTPQKKIMMMMMMSKKIQATS